MGLTVPKRRLAIEELQRLEMVEDEVLSRSKRRGSMCLAQYRPIVLRDPASKAERRAVVRMGLKVQQELLGMNVRLLTMESARFDVLML